jgi:ATP-dependent exoDNAse (exonuclease V) beta subunit
MPKCSKDINPKGVEITFEEETHKYTSIINNQEVNYISGTTFISQFFPQFDPDGSITKKCAQKRGLTVEALKNEWKEKAHNACLYGTKIHETCEDILLNTPLRNAPNSTREQLSMEIAQKAAHKILERCTILGVEKIIFDEQLKIAGTMDLFVKSKKDGKIWIIDWKTNEKIETNNIYKKYGLPPIEHIPDTNYGHYTMQLNLYEYILKKVGYVNENIEIGKCLIHITETGVKSYVLKTHQNDIKKMVETII